MSRTGTATPRRRPARWPWSPRVLRRPCPARSTQAPDVDYFTLRMPQAGGVVVETTGTTATRGTVWQDGAELGTAASGGAGRNFRLHVHVAAGPVVIAVAGNGRGTGRYTLHTTLIVGYLENPGLDSHQSGIRVVSGWVCNAEEIELEIGETGPQMAAYGTARVDTAATCGDTDNGCRAALQLESAGRWRTHHYRAGQRRRVGPHHRGGD